MTPPILSIRNATKTYRTPITKGWGMASIRALDGVSIDVFPGETLAIVGESGSGKSTIAKLLLMLQVATEGEVMFNDKSLTALTYSEVETYRRNVQAVFQDPSSSLNPRMTIERSLGFIVRRHALCQQGGEREFISRQLKAVGLSPPESFLHRYPFELSGGQQQRVAIARAMMLEPAVIVADEPLSSLDVSIQAQVLQLFRDLHEKKNVGLVIISHDLGAMQSIADRIIVLYRGKIVEMGSDILKEPAHPYTKMLLDATLVPDPKQARIRKLAAAGSQVPIRQAQLATPSAGCRFRNRCSYAIELCAMKDPQLKSVVREDHLAACHRAAEIVTGDAPLAQEVL